MIQEKYLCVFDTHPGFVFLQLSQYVLTRLNRGRTNIAEGQVSIQSIRRGLQSNPKPMT